MARGAKADDNAPRKRGRPSKGVRDSVLAATRALIQDEGIAAVTTSAVAERAGASEASIHYHFGSKEALLQAAILEALAPLRSRGLGSGASADEPADEEVLRLATLLERVYDDLVPLLAAVQADRSLREAIGPQLSADDLGPHRAVVRVARCIADESAADGAIEDAEAAAMLIVGACFLRAWERQVSTHKRRALPSLGRAIAVLLGEQ